ncbi:MAG: leucine-rich repeat protein [Clostridia bacterium]|nr:leucine-rich repeat protein [Clostridia bacterium]
MKRACLSFLLFLCFLLPPSFVLADDPSAPPWYICGDYQYFLLDDGTAEIGHYSGEDTVVVIPDTLDGYAVTQIRCMAFAACSLVTSVTIPDSITTAEGNPFAFCNNLSTITVSSDHPTWAVIDGVLFDQTNQTLICRPTGKMETEYTVPQGTRKLAELAFCCCSSLTGVSIPDSVTVIGDGAFCQCSGLTALFLPDSVAVIGAYAFERCTGLTQISLPDSLAAIGYGAFEYCESLTGITLPSRLSVIDYALFFDCDGLTEVFIPDSVAEIGDCAFESCGLTVISIPDSVTVIGEDAFCDNPDLTALVGRGSYAEQYCRENGISFVFSDQLD